MSAWWWPRLTSLVTSHADSMYPWHHLIRMALHLCSPYCQPHSKECESHWSRTHLRTDSVDWDQANGHVQPAYEDCQAALCDHDCGMATKFCFLFLLLGHKRKYTSPSPSNEVGPRDWFWIIKSKRKSRESFADWGNKNLGSLFFLVVATRRPPGEKKQWGSLSHHTEDCCPMADLVWEILYSLRFFLQLWHSLEWLYQ